jgi:adenine deaminase
MRRRWVAVARGDEEADLVLSGGRVLSVFTGELFSANVAICDGHVVGVGDYEAKNTYDASGRVLLPGFIDGHCHIESSKLNVDEFARTIVACGTTSVVIDPHEMANVLGAAGVEYMLEASKGLPLGVYVMAPSCVPASPFESCASPLEACDYAELLTRQRVIGVAEMMNYPAAVAGSPEVMAKMAMTGYRHIDGHAPGLSGRQLNAYLVSGPSSDHECTTLEEALEKRRLGMWIMIREASMIRNMIDLLPLVQQYGTEQCMFVTDDREAGTLLEEGHINSMVATAVRHGLSGRCRETWVPERRALSWSYRPRRNRTRVLGGYHGHGRSG